MLAVLVLIGGAACRDATGLAAPAVQFKVDGPLCDGSVFNFRFSIDQVVVGTEALKDGQASQRYSTDPGQHDLGATIPGTITVRDTTVVLRAGETLVYVLPLYCS